MDEAICPNKKKFFLFPILLLLLAGVTGTYAQVGVQFIRCFGDQGSQKFEDIYSTADGCYIMCGQTIPVERVEPFVAQGYIVKASNNGNEEWSLAFGHEDGGAALFSIIELDGGDYAVAGGGGDPGRILAARISHDGDVVWSRLYDGGHAKALIELKSGDLVVTGQSTINRRNYRFLLRINPDDGEVVWYRRYEDFYYSRFYGLREAGDAVVAAGDRFLMPPPVQGMLLGKYEQEDGDPIWERIWEPLAPPDRSYDVPFSFCSNPGGFVLSGVHNWNHVNDPSVGYTVYVNEDGEETRHVLADFALRENFALMWYGNCRLENGGIVQAGISGWGSNHPAMNWISSEGEELWHQIYYPQDLGNFAANQGYFKAVAPSRDGGAIACGHVRNLDADSSFDGFIMKLEPLIDGPVIYYRSPGDSIIDVLVNDSLHFTIGVRDPLQRDISYVWLRNDSDTLSTDSTVLVRFPDIGQESIACVVSIGELAASVVWHITVTDLYVHSYTPDTLALTVRRGESIDFSLDSVRAVEGDSIEYLWLKRNVDIGDEVDTTGRDAGATIPFLQSGHYRIDGMAFRGESSDIISWDVSVRGAIWAFAPEDLAFEVLPDSQVSFIVEPTFPDAEEQTIQWLIDGELAAEDTTLFNWSFGEADSCPPHLVQVVVTDTVEADTVTWTVMVVDPDFVDDKRDAYPTRADLLSVVPNPFNSMLTIRYSNGTSPLTPPASGGGKVEMRLAIFDISGRLVVDFSETTPPYSPPSIEGGGRAGSPSIEGGVSAGSPSMEGGRNTATYGKVAVGRIVIWDASAVPAGVYFVRLQSGSQIVTKKVVLMR